MKRLALALAAASFAASVLPADAFVIGRTTTTSQTVNNVLVNLFQAPGVIVTPFNLPSARTVAISYSAVCAVSGVGGYVHIDVVVDGITRSPTVGSTDRFCSSDQTAGIDNAAMRSITLPVSLSAGPHQLIVRAQAMGGGIVATLDDSATVIQD